MLGLTEKSGDIMRTVDKLDKIGPEKVKTILVEDFAVSESDADEILNSSPSRAAMRKCWRLWKATPAETRCSIRGSAS